MKAVLIYSGGLDSTSALYTYQDRIELAVSFDYGSRHNKQEIERAKWNCEKLGIPHQVVELDFSFLKSALLGDEPVPHGHYEDESMKSTVVPFRNGVMLSIATAIAESNNFDAVIIGSHSGDHAVYPDCRIKFNDFFRRAMEWGTYNSITLFSPFESMDKKEVANTGIQNGMDPEQTYSCYEGGEEQCGKCSTCMERKWALGEITQEELDATK